MLFSQSHTHALVPLIRLYPRARTHTHKYRTKVITLHQPLAFQNTCVAHLNYRLWGLSHCTSTMACICMCYILRDSTLDWNSFFSVSGHAGAVSAYMDTAQVHLKMRWCTWKWHRNFQVAQQFSGGMLSKLQAMFSMLLRKRLGAQSTSVYSRCALTLCLILEISAWARVWNACMEHVCEMLAWISSIAPEKAHVHLNIIKVFSGAQLYFQVWYIMSCVCLPCLQNTQFFSTCHSWCLARSACK